MTKEVLFAGVVNETANMSVLRHHTRRGSMAAVTTTYTKHPWTKFYEAGVQSSLRYPESTLGSILSETAAKFPAKTALLFYGKKITFAELDRLANRFANALAGLGVKKGDRVALMLPNVPQMIIGYYGSVRLGAIAVATNPLYLEHELEVQLKDSGSETLVALDLFYPRIERILSKTRVKRLILCGIKDYLPFPLNLLYPIKAKLEKQWVKVKKEPPLHDFLALIGKAAETPPHSVVSPDDIAILQYTGGTTGIPKGAVLTHRNLVVNAAQCRAWLTLRHEGEERVLAALPFFHVYGMTTGMNLGILIGAELILIPKFHTKEVLETIHKYRPTIFPGIQAMYLAIGNYPKIGKYDLTSIKAAIIVEGYGLSEASPVTHANPIFGRRKMGSIGLPWPDMEARIVDLATGTTELPVGEAGELVVKGPQVMKGYWNKPGETATAIRGGWLHTGDIAKMDEEGYFFIVDRIKDMIKTVGENVYPREVEEVLYAHPKVKEAVVVGIPEEFKGEMIKAYLVLKDGQTATAEEIIGFCREQLSKFKVPKSVEFRGELPKTLVGKVLRRVLRDEELKKTNSQAPKS